MTKRMTLLTLVTAIVCSVLTQPCSAHYDPKLGRWLERDPLPPIEHLADTHADTAFGAPRLSDYVVSVAAAGVPPVRLGTHYEDGASLYQYVRSDPLRFVDPPGLKGASLKSLQAVHDRNCARLKGQLRRGVITPRRFADYWTMFNCDGNVADELLKECIADCRRRLGGNVAVGVATGGAIVNAPTGPYVRKPRGGVAGGGPAGDRTSWLSRWASNKYGSARECAKTRTIRGAGRVASRASAVVTVAAGSYAVGNAIGCRAQCLDALGLSPPRCPCGPGDSNTDGRSTPSGGAQPSRQQ